MGLGQSLGAVFTKEYPGVACTGLLLPPNEQHTGHRKVQGAGEWHAGAVRCAAAWPAAEPAHGRAGRILPEFCPVFLYRAVP